MSGIRWRKVAKGHYRHAGTGVEIKFGFARLYGWSSSSEWWFVYEPDDSDSLAAVPISNAISLREAKERAVDSVESVRTALADPSNAARWKPWRDHLRDLYGNAHDIEAKE